MRGHLSRVSAVARRELFSCLASPVAWVFLSIFLLLSGFCTFVATGIISLGQADLTPFFDWMPWLFLIVVPALGMPIWAEERKSGTFELLLSLPAELWELVLGKFLAGTLVLAAALALTFPAPLTMIFLGKPDLGAVACGYAGSLLAGMAFLSIAGFCSALFKTQTSSFLLSVALCSALIFVGWPPFAETVSAWAPEWLLRLLSECALIPHCQSFERGLLDTGEFVYCLSLSGLFLWLTAASLEFAAVCGGGLFSPGAMSDPSAKRALVKLGANVLAALLAAVSVNVIASSFRARLDLSADGAYSLSSEAKGLAGSLGSPATLRLYYSRSNPAMPAPLRKYAERVEWLLEEFRLASGGRLSIKRIDPEPDSEAAEAAALDGVKGVPVRSGETVFLGISATHAGKVAAIPFLSPQQESLLEYEICRALLNATRARKPKVGVMSALPVMGSSPAEAPQSPGQAPKPAERPWHAISELADDFELLKLPLDLASIPDGTDALLAVHPSGIPERTEYALDQYLLRGGRMAVFLDPRSFYAVLKSQTDHSMIDKVESSLDKLLPAWGVSYNKNTIIADMVFAYRKTLPGKMVTNPLVLNLTPDGIERENPVCGGLSALSLYFAGFFSGTPPEGAKMETLLKSTKESQIVSAFIAERPELAIKNFIPSGVNYALAARLRGKFKSAFSEAPAGFRQDPAKPRLAQSERDGEVFLFGDSDMLFNDVCVRVSEDALGQCSILRQNDNISLLQNVVEQMCGSSELSRLRGRTPMSRPLSKVNEIKAKAELAYKGRILEIERELAETQGRLNKLQALKSKDSQTKLSPEQQSELKEFSKRLADAKGELKSLRQGLKADLDSLEMKVRLLNILAVPCLVLLFGLAWPRIARLLASRRGKE